MGHQVRVEMYVGLTLLLKNRDLMAGGDSASLT